MPGNTPGPRAPARRIPANGSGRDFVVGDLHGEFKLLADLLAIVNFDPQGDRLLCVGDLIDRGPHSPRAAWWLRQPWLASVRGNHEAMALDAQWDDDVLRTWTQLNGGDWWWRADAGLKAELLAAFEALPYVLEIDTADATVGIVHAEVPTGLSWQAFTTGLGRDARLRDHALWSRERVFGGLRATVPGVRHIFCGHTPIAEPAALGNHMLIDTGACYGGALTLAALDATRLWTIDAKSGKVRTIAEPFGHLAAV